MSFVIFLEQVQEVLSFLKLTIAKIYFVFKNIWKVQEINFIWDYRSNKTPISKVEWNISDFGLHNN